MRKIFFLALLFALSLTVYPSHFAKLIYKKDLVFNNGVAATESLNVSAFEKVRISLVSNQETDIEAEIKLFDGQDAAGTVNSFKFSKTHTVVIDVPSTHLSISAKGEGKLKIYVWGV